MPPSDYELAVNEAAAQAGRIVKRVYCAEDGGEVGVIRYTPLGELFWADVPVEPGSGTPRWRKRLQELTGKRSPPVVYAVRYLIDRGNEAPDAPMVRCEKGDHRIEGLHLLDFQSHSGRLRVKPV
jgi:hypothetical protein